MAKKPENADQAQQTVSMRLRYDKTDTLFASQFIVNATREELIVNFSPGPLADPQSNQQLLPVHTRIAMTPQGAARLAQTLTNALKNLQAAAQASSAEEGENPESVN